MSHAPTASNTERQPKTAGIAEPADYVARFRARTLAQALLDGWTAHNARQARRWEAARPRPEDFLGGSTIEAQRERYRRMTAVAAAYRSRASVAPFEELTTDMLNVVREGEGAR